MTDGTSDNAHELRDEEKLRLHQLVARELARDPRRVLDIAIENLRRWTDSDSESPYYREWLEILRTYSVQELAALLVADTEEARRLRQSTPFVGVVSREERDEIVRGGRRS